MFIHHSMVVPSPIIATKILSGTVYMKINAFDI